MAGRPTLRTPEIVKALEHAFSMGSTIEGACFHAGIAPSTYYSWCEKDAEFMERNHALKELQVLKALETVSIAIESDPSMAKWYLERRHPDFRPKQDIDHSGKVETPTTVTFVGVKPKS